jgi:RNA polymerase sigma-70 factor (ECF subfamily)
MLRTDPFRDAPTLIRRVYAYAAYRLGDGPDAEDVTSETFERGLRYRDSFDPLRGEPVAWLLGIARRCIAEALATRSETVGEVPDTAGTLDLEDDAVRRVDLRTAVLQLDDRDRELIALRYGADLTARQIAELLELKTNAVEVALHRALARLRERLERRGDEEDEEASFGGRAAPPRVRPLGSDGSAG